jgi:hypothetical protein
MRIEFGSTRSRLRWLRECHIYLWWLRERYGYPPPTQLCDNDPIALTVLASGPVVNNRCQVEYRIHWRYGPMYLTFAAADGGMANNVVIASGLSKEEAYARREQLLAIIRPGGRLL